MRPISQKRRIQSFNGAVQSAQPRSKGKHAVVRGLALAVAAAASSLLSSQSAMATSDIWDGSVDGSWLTVGNWSTDPASAPGAGETATFSLSAAAVNNNTTIDLGTGATIGAIVFDTANAAAYTIGAGAAGSQTLTLDTLGNAIVVNDSVVNNQLFNANLALSNATTPGVFTFANNSTAASLTFAGGISAANAGIKVMQIAGAGQTNISGAITAGAGSMNLLKTGSGTLVLSGGGAFNGNGTQGNPSGNYPVVLREGTTRIVSGTYSVNGEVVLGGVLVHGDPGWNNTLIMDGGTFTTNNWFSVGRGNGTGGVSTDVVLNNSAFLGVTNLSGGYNGGNAANTPKGSVTLNGSSIFSVSNTVNWAESPGSNYTLTINDTATFRQTANTSQTRVGGDAGATGTIILNGGTASFERDLVLGFRGTGELVLNSGWVNVANATERWLIMGQELASSGRITVNGGTLMLNANTDIRMATNNNATGASTVTLNAGGAITGGVSSVIDLHRANNSAVNNTFNMNGGTLTIAQIVSDNSSGTRTLNLNGGVIKPTGNSTNFINLGTGNAFANVLAGGVKIDTSGFNVTVVSPLLDGGGGGGLTKDGAGVLTLAGANTYAGPTVINGGRLVLSGSLASASSMSVGSGAELDLVTGAANAVSVSALSLNNSVLNYEFANSTTDSIAVSGAVATTGTSTINLTNSAGFSSGSYNLITAGGGGLGTSAFSLGAVPVGFFDFALAAPTANALVLNVTAINPTPAVAYWTGATGSGNWTAGSAVTLSNWATNASGTTDALQVPGTTTDVIFTATNATGVAGALNTTVDGTYSLKSLTIDVPASTAITSVGINTNGNNLMVDGGGITVAATSNASGSITGTGTVILSGSQTWANNSNTAGLTVSAPVSGSTGAITLTVGGSGSADVTIGGGIRDGGGNVALVVNKPTGVTNLSGASSFSGGATIMAGNLNVSGTLTSSAVLNVGGEGGTGLMGINPGANVTVNNLVNVGYRTGDGTLNMTGGTLNTSGDFRIGGSDQNGAAYDAQGTVNISGGVASFSSVTVARGNFTDNSAAGTLNISGGTVTSVNDVILGFAGSGLGKMSISGTGVFNVGTTATKWMMLGYWDTTKGQLDISGGALNLNFGSSLILGRETNNAGSATINQTGGSITSFSDNATTVGGSGGLDMQYRGTGTFSSTYNLDGGTLSIFRIFSSTTSGTRVFNFNGGTLKPVATDAAFMNLGSGSATANVRNGGAKIDTAGFNVTIATPLLHSSIPGDAAIDGGLTKSGAGALVLSGNATYTGPTVVNAGTLAINKTNSGGGAISVASGAALALNSVAATGSLSASSMTLSDSILSFNLGAAFPTAPLYNLSGGLDRSGNNVINVAGSLATGTITLIQYAGSETGSGSFSLGTLPNRTTATIHDLGAGKVDLALVVNALKWSGLGDGSWTTAVQTPKNWTDGVNPIDYTEGDPVLFDDSASVTTVNLPANVSPAGMTVNNSTQSYTLTGTGGITGTAALAKTGTNTLYIANTGTNSYSGGTTIGAGGTVEFSGPAVTTAQTQFLGSGAIVNDGVIRFNRAPSNGNEFATVFLWNNISGSGSIIASQNGQLGGANTFDGSVTVQSGATLFLDSSGALGSAVGGTVVEDGGRIAMYPSMNLGTEAITIAGNGPSYIDQGTQAGYSTNGAIYSGGNSTIGGTVTLSGNAAINVGGGTLNLTGTLAGASFDLTKNGGGRLILAGPTTYNNTVVSGGRLQIGNEGTLGSLGSGNVTMTGGGIDFRRSDTYTVANYITGTGVVYNIGTGTVILTNTSSDYFGVVGANAGTIILKGAAFASSILAEGNGTVRVANNNYGSLLSVASINSNNAQTGAMELSDGVNNPFNGIDLNFSGRANATTGLRSVAGSNTLNSNIVLNSGGDQYRIEAAAGGTFDITGGISGIGTLGSARTVTFDGAGVGTMSGTIANGGAATLNIAKTGTGTWTLNNSNSYTGTTTVNGGKLVLVGAAKSPVLTGDGANVLAGRLILDYADDATVPAQVLAALDAGYDQSPKFSSGKLRTSNAADPNKGLGWLDVPASTQVTVAYTYLGDTNLDGQVDITDLGNLATAWQTAGVWAAGDSDYSGFIDITDLGALATNWQQGVGNPLAPSFGEALAAVGLGGVSVPEPGMLGMIGIGLATAMARRRTRRG